MSDFYQTGTISTLHRLKEFDAARIEKDLSEFSQTNRIALVLPALGAVMEDNGLCLAATA